MRSNLSFFLSLFLFEDPNHWTKRTVSAIIIGEMEMWRCPDYLFPVCMLLCFVDPILGNRYGPDVIP